MKTKIERIEEAIDRNRNMILKGGDRLYYTRQILKLNELLHKEEEKEIESRNINN